MLPSFSSCTTSPPPATFLESIFPLPLQSFTPMPTNDNHVDNSSSETTKSVPRQFFNWPSFLQSQLPSVKSQIAPSARARAHTVEPYVSNSSNNQKLIYDRGMSANPTATAVKQLQQSAGCNIETTTNTVNVTSGIHALYASSEQQQHDENFTDLLLTQKLSSVSPTSPFSIALIQQQQQFDTLSVYNNEGNNNSKALDTLLHYSDLQRESQPLSCWSNLSFYNDEYSNLTLTPTTPPFGNNDSKLAMSKSAFTYPFDKLAELQYSSFSAEILHIGTWKRMTFQTGDLLCQFNKKTELFTWRIRDGPCYFKMEFPQSILQSISLQLLNERAGWARLEVTLTSTDSISFYMEKKVATGGVSNNPADANEDSTSVDQSATATATNIWVQCIDYTEDKQASLINIHQLDGPALALKSELALLAEESEYVASLLIKE
ncbi:hypothetical protein BDF20DRAFT_844955 [Mycotypha africana]|uniref:uncharacterized protein n=1 Tax=Mycotypha africana TaxID=64632 RepID=UPI0023004AD6|nr:uncharacterized protein BDF20DRAFT_844955 [Mycotypha africana]KAI8991490.1 hypothetical protein BDF20DRAFT_844955 [Mycotypha africana]